MYEHVNVPEPTCEGWWWEKRPGCSPVVRWFKRGSRGWHVFDGDQTEGHPWASDGDHVLTGPIPMPPEPRRVSVCSKPPLVSVAEKELTRRAALRAINAIWDALKTKTQQRAKGVLPEEVSAYEKALGGSRPPGEIASQLADVAPLNLVELKGVLATAAMSLEAK